MARKASILALMLFKGLQRWGRLAPELLYFNGLGPGCEPEGPPARLAHCPVDFRSIGQGQGPICKFPRVDAHVPPLREVAIEALEGVADTEDFGSSQCEVVGDGAVSVGLLPQGEEGDGPGMVGHGFKAMRGSAPRTP